MNAADAYQSSIPADATETITRRYEEDGAKREAEYFHAGEKVGWRLFEPSGAVEWEKACRNGVLHGWEYMWYELGTLLSAAPYENGLPHGVAYQWARDGRLLGTYTMVHGTGVDLWWQDWQDGSANLAEVHYYQEGKRHGWEWWLTVPEHIDEERHWQNYELHGIEREWNFAGGLRRGWPRYFIRGERVTKQKYVNAAASDPTLPPFRAEDNKPERTFPPEVARYLRV